MPRQATLVQAEDSHLLCGTGTNGQGDQTSYLQRTKYRFHFSFQKQWNSSPECVRPLFRGNPTSFADCAAHAMRTHRVQSDIHLWTVELLCSSGWKGISTHTNTRTGATPKRITDVTVIKHSFYGVASQLDLAWLRLCAGVIHVSNSPLSLAMSSRNPGTASPVFFKIFTRPGATLRSLLHTYVMAVPVLPKRPVLPMR